MKVNFFLRSFVIFYKYLGKEIILAISKKKWFSKKKKKKKRLILDYKISHDKGISASLHIQLPTTGISEWNKYGKDVKTYKLTVTFIYCLLLGQSFGDF